MGREGEGAGGRTAGDQLLPEVVEAVAPGRGGAFAAGLSRSLWQPGGLLLQGGPRQGCGHCFQVPHGRSGEVQQDMLGAREGKRAVKEMAFPPLKL